MGFLDLSDEQKNTKIKVGLHRALILICINVAILIFVFVLDIDTMENTISDVTDRVLFSGFAGFMVYAYCFLFVIPLLRWSMKGFIDGR